MSMFDFWSSLSIQHCYLLKLTCLLQIGPPNSRFLTSNDKSTWNAKDVVDSVLADKSSLVINTSFLISNYILKKLNGNGVFNFVEMYTNKVVYNYIFQLLNLKLWFLLLNLNHYFFFLVHFQIKQTTSPEVN